MKRPASPDELRDACGEHLQELEKMIQKGLGTRILQRELYDSSFPSDHNEAMIVAYGDVIDIDWDWSDADVLGTDVISIPFSCVVSGCTLDMFVFKGEYWSFSDEEEAKFSVYDADWNEHYMWVQFETDLEVEATMSVQVCLDTSGGHRAFRLGTLDIELTRVSLRQ